MVFWEREMYFLSLILKIFQDFLNLKMLWIAWKSLLKVSSQFRGLFFWAKIYLKKSPATQPNHQIFPTPQNHKIISKFTRKKSKKYPTTPIFIVFPPPGSTQKNEVFPHNIVFYLENLLVDFFFNFFIDRKYGKISFFRGEENSNKKKKIFNRMEIWIKQKIYTYINKNPTYK